MFCESRYFINLEMDLKNRSPWNWVKEQISWVPGSRSGKWFKPVFLLGKLFNLFKDQAKPWWGITGRVKEASCHRSFSLRREWTQLWGYLCHLHPQHLSLHLSLCASGSNGKMALTWVLVQKKKIKNSWMKGHFQRREIVPNRLPLSISS